MARVRTAALILLLLLLPGCGRRGTGYDPAAVVSDLGEMLQRPADFQALYKGYSRTADFRCFLRELEAGLEGSALSIRDSREALSAVLGLIRQHHLERMVIEDPLLLSRYHADLLITLLTLKEGVEGFLAGLHELTVRALAGAGVRPEVIEGLGRALRALRLRQPFLRASPPYAAETHEDLLGEIPATVELAMRLLERGWKVLGFYEEGRAKIARIQFLNIIHLQAVIDLVAAEGPWALFLQVEQALDGTDRDLRQVADRVEATADYLQEGGFHKDFDLAPGSRGISVLIVEEGSVEGLWQEIERRAGFLEREIPILMVYGEGNFRALNLEKPEARELLQALGYSSSSCSFSDSISIISCFRSA